MLHETVKKQNITIQGMTYACIYIYLYVYNMYMYNM